MGSEKESLLYQFFAMNYPKSLDEMGCPNYSGDFDFVLLSHIRFSLTVAQGLIVKLSTHLRS